MANRQPAWGSNVKVSLPEPYDGNEERVSVGGGFVFTETGLKPDMNSADHESLSMEAWRPGGLNG